MTGFIPISRKMFSETDDLWNIKRSLSQFEARLDLIQLAQYSDEEKSRLFGYRVIKTARGEIAASSRYLADRWRWPRTNVQRFLNYLKDKETISLESRGGQMVISLINYEQYNQMGCVENVGQNRATDRATERATETPDITAKDDERGPQNGPQSGPNLGQNRNKVNKEIKIITINKPDEISKSYADIKADFETTVTRAKNDQEYTFLACKQSGFELSRVQELIDEMAAELRTVGDYEPEREFRTHFLNRVRKIKTIENDKRDKAERTANISPGFRQQQKNALFIPKDEDYGTL